MTIFEMIIEVRQATQNIAANTRRKILDDEIVWLLNKNQERFIQSKVKPRKDGSGGFQVDQLDADAIRPLLTTQHLIANVDDADDVYTCQLPGDYSYLISDDSRTYLLCGDSLTNPPATSADSESVLILNYPYSNKSAAPFYSDLQLILGTAAPNYQTITLSDIKALYGSTFSGTNSKAERYIMVDLFLWYIRNILGLKAYWEKYENIIAPNSFLFPGWAAGSIVPEQGVVATAGTVQTVNRIIYNNTLGNWHPNRLSPGDKVSSMLDTAYLKPSYLSPISELWGNKLIVHGGTSFIVTGVSIDYVKKPRKLSLILNQDCELPAEFHNAICDLTVEYIKAMIADPNWQVKLHDNMVRSIPIT